MLFSDKRIIINDNSRRCEVKEMTDYAYAGVKVLDDRNPRIAETGYGLSILNAAEYIYAITENKMPHSINTPQVSYNNKLVIEAIEKSYTLGQEISIEEGQWKR